MKYRWWNPPLRCPRCKNRIERPYFVHESLFESCDNCKAELYLKYLSRHDYWEVHDLQLAEKVETTTIVGIKIRRKNILATAAACLSVLIVAGFLWAGLAGQNETPSQSAAQVNPINPGLFLQCSHCGEAIYNVTRKQACSIIRNSRMLCPFCESGDVMIKAKCPKCSEIYNINWSKIENSSPPACFLEAICPACKYQLISETILQSPSVR